MVFYKKEGRPSRWKDGLNCSFVHRSLIAELRGGSKLLAVRTLGPRLKGLGCFLLGHLRRREWRVVWRDVSDVYLAKRPTQVIFENVGAGGQKVRLLLTIDGLDRRGINDARFKHHKSCNQEQ